MAAAYLQAPSATPRFYCGKVTHTSRKLALRALRGSNKWAGLTAIGSGHNQAYWCGECQGYHLGSRKRVNERVQ